MARYRFNLHECGVITEDEEGIDLDASAVQTMAVDAARDVMAHEVKQGRLCLSCHIEVLDGSGRAVMIIPFRDAIAVHGLCDGC